MSHPFNSMLITTLFLLLCSIATQASNTSPDTEARQVKTLTFDCFANKGHIHHELLTRLTRRLYEPQGYQINFVSSQTEKDTLSKLISGELDGSCGRSSISDGLYPEIKEHMTDLDIPVLNFGVNLLTPTPLVFSNLKHMTFGVSPNIAMIEDQLIALGLKKIIHYKDSHDLLNDLKKGVIDGLIAYETFFGFEPSFHGELEKLNSVRLIHSSLSPRLHKRHQNLLPAAKQALQAWYKEQQNNQTSSEETERVEKIFAPTPKTQHLKTITFSCGTKKWDNAYTTGVKLFGSAFKTLGYNFQMVSVPKAREQIMLASGQVDGSCGLSSGTNQASGQQLIPIEIPLLQYHVELWGNKPLEAFSSYAEIPEGSTVSYTRGLMVLEDIISELPQIKAVDSLSVAQVIRLSASGRTDYGLGVDKIILNYQKNLTTKQHLFLKMRSGPHTMYAYLTPNNQALAEPLTRVLTQLTKNYKEPI